ncbi:MAG TPA: ATP-binding protein [Flavihumibacter sp.]|nr:ATP-binding protein [Flavihumibacter sp.]HPZ86850.1 ATP-binding protein [Flavihumibacter sp.]HQD08154.1 ATP-binding protein [Flavihumibacter sp.]
MTKSAFKILVVAAAEAECKRLHRLLSDADEKGEWTIKWTNYYHAAVDHICAKAFDVYLVDIDLGDKDGIALLKEAIDMGCVEPFILLTETKNRSRELAAMGTGAMDYLIKDHLTAEELGRSIRFAMERYYGAQVIRWNENLFRQLFEQSHDAIFLLNENHQFSEVNPAMEKMLGQTKCALKGMQLADIASSARQANDLLVAFMAGESVTDEEINILSSGDEEFHCLLSLSRVKDLTGRELIYGLLHNITNRRKAERAQRLVENLSAGRRLTQYLAHEIKNPVLNIQLSANQLEKLVPATANTYLDIIDRNAEKIVQILYQLLHFTDSSRFLFDNIDGQTLLQQIIDAARDTLLLQQVQLQYKPAPKDFQVRADRHQLVKAFQNIINNAIEAMPANNALLSVSVSLQQNTVTVKITDNGKGMDETSLSRLFEPYFSTKESGTGLGLTAALFIIESHKGRIEVISNLGTGSSFLISLPLVKASTAPASTGCSC